MAPRASDWAGSLTITLDGAPSPVRCNRYSNEEKPLSTAICSARTPVTVAPSIRVSHLPSSSSTVEGTTAVAEVTVDASQTNDTEQRTSLSMSPTPAKVVSLPQGHRRLADRVPALRLLAGHRMLEALEHRVGQFARLDQLLVARRNVAKVEEVALPVEFAVSRVSEPAATDTMNQLLIAIDVAGEMLPEADDFADLVVDNHPLVGVFPPLEAFHLLPHGDVADLVDPDTHDILLRPHVPAVGRIVGVERSENLPVADALGLLIDVNPFLHDVFEFFAGERGHRLVSLCVVGCVCRCVRCTVLCSRPRAPPITHLRRAFQLHHHLRVVVAVGLRRLSHLELILAQKNREDGLDLHGGK